MKIKWCLISWSSWRGNSWAQGHLYLTCHCYSRGVTKTSRLRPTRVNKDCIWLTDLIFYAADVRTSESLRLNFSSFCERKKCDEQNTRP